MFSLCIPYKYICGSLLLTVIIYISLFYGNSKSVVFKVAAPGVVLYTKWPPFLTKELHSNVSITKYKLYLYVIILYFTLY